MSVKCTKELTRNQAELKYWDLKHKLDRPICYVTDNDLEYILEEMNDRLNDGEGYENYTIS